MSKPRIQASDKTLQALLNQQKWEEAFGTCKRQHFNHSNNVENRLIYLKLALICGEDLSAYQIIQKELSFEVKAYLLEGVFEVYRLWYQEQRFEKLAESANLLKSMMPGLGLAWNFLGIAELALGRLDSALVTLEQAANLCPDNPHVLTNYANILIASLRPDLAVPIAEKALTLDPTIVPLLINAGNAWRLAGNPDRAIELYHRALLQTPENAELLANLGMAQNEKGETEEALKLFVRALDVNPKMYLVSAKIAMILIDQGELDTARTILEQVLRDAPESQEVWYIYGYLLQKSNSINGAIDALVKSISIKNKHKMDYESQVYTQLLFCMNYHPDIGPADSYAIAKEFDEKFSKPYEQFWVQHGNVRDPQKKIKLGFLAHSFGAHPCARFMLPLIANFDPNHTEVFLFATNHKVDSITEQFQSLTPHYFKCAHMSDFELVNLIREKEIDVLVEIDGHTFGNRLKIMSYKPAPVSMHWLDYGNTTGMTCIDYYLSDGIAAPLDSQAYFAEKIWVMDGSPYVFKPMSYMGGVGELPAKRNGHITFGCLSRSIRINPRVVRVWSAIMHAIPDAKLIINSNDLKDKNIAEEMANRFVLQGVARDRLLVGFDSPPWDLMRNFDIGLDCFPHNSGTTLFEMLYMGIPYVTLADRPPVGRLGASILTHLGHPEWIATNEEEYAQKLVILAHDWELLSEIRANLRQEMERSPVMDAPLYAKNFEKSIRQMWQTYCEEHTS